MTWFLSSAFTRSDNFFLQNTLSSLSCCILTNTRDPISGVPRVTRAVERSFGVGAVGVSVTVISIRLALLNVCNKNILRRT